MPIVTKTMNQIGPCVYTRYNENMYKKHTTHKSLNSYNEYNFQITHVLKNSCEIKEKKKNVISFKVAIKENLSGGMLGITFQVSVVQC